MSTEKFSLIRGILSKLGLSKEAVDDVIDLVQIIPDKKGEIIFTKKYLFWYYLRKNKVK